MVRFYPNTSNEEGLRCLKEVLDKRQNKTVSNKSLIELTELVLKDSYFKFNDRSRKQKEGTALGTKFFPRHAIIFMAALEEGFLEHFRR